MDKQQEAQADSISAVGVQIKPDYPPSEVYGSEPPPAYQRPRPTAVQIARIAALTLVAVSFILGFFMVASAYITATATCYQDYPATPEHAEDRPVFQALVDPLDTEESSHTKRESAEPPSRSHQQHEQQSEDREEPIHLKLPLQLDFDELAGSMIEKNQRSRMNCVVEKRRAEEVMDHQPKTVRLPFGVNLTTDPRYEHITGERMAIFCESGNDQRKPTQMKPVKDLYFSSADETTKKFEPASSNEGSEIHNVPLTPKTNPKQSRKWVTEQFLTPADDIDMEYGPVSSNLSNEVEEDSTISFPRPVKVPRQAKKWVTESYFTPTDDMFQSSGPFARHVPMEQEQNVPMMQMHVVPIQVQQIPLHPNAIPHGPHPIHMHHQAPQQGRPLAHMMAPHMNGPQSGHMGPQMPPQMAQQPQQMHPHFQQIPAGELPPQVLQAVQEQLAAEQQMAAQQHMAQQNRRFPPQAQLIPADSAEQVFIQEEIIPILHQHGHPRPEGRSMEGSPVLQAIEAVEQHPVPSDTVKPPPPPAFTPLRAADRPHYVQPRSIRDVSSLLKREKRVRRCACDCSC